MALNHRQRRFLRGLAHGLSPVVSVGQNGVSPGVLAAIDKGLDDHELIKIRFSADCKEDYLQLLDQALSLHRKGELVQSIGHTAVVYRQSDERKLALPN